MFTVLPIRIKLVLLELLHHFTTALHFILHLMLQIGMRMRGGTVPFCHLYMIGFCPLNVLYNCMSIKL